MTQSPHLGQPLPIRAFSLIEVLIVIAILAVLSAMAMPILSVARRAARVSATRSVMHKADIALGLFREDTGVYPYQRSYADTAAGEVPNNRLYHHLGTTLTTDEVLRLHQDADAAASAYAYPCGNNDSPPTEQAPASPHAFRTTDIKPAPSSAGFSAAWTYVQVGGVWKWQPNLGNAGTRLATCVLLNRMAAERARLAIWSGNVDVVGNRHLDAMHPDGTVFMAGRDLSAIPLLTVKLTEVKPGWGDDYLNGELPLRHRKGEAILDAWRRPLAYVCQVTEGMRGARGYILRSNVHWIDARIYGLDKQGRRTLAPADPISGEVTPADGAYLPDPSRLRDSDRRRWAAPGLEHRFELWSPGPDGRLDWMRTHPVNTDNVGHEPYDLKILP